MVALVEWRSAIVLVGVESKFALTEEFGLPPENDALDILDGG